jgi:hypothetical protein
MIFDTKMPVPVNHAPIMVTVRLIRPKRARRAEPGCNDSCKTGPVSAMLPDFHTHLRIERPENG